ncbi:hypothetical protein [Nocardiopsis metallicus]|uniref:Glycosyl hydrolase family 32 N-terminal domain-containing protein n=1 Tax=Nocardiopsis metallicus TaxID=179819 RepID=A0A840W9K5_9ACTN|nr:hypothetical protein [Nocardiopsis metallicus]MBB5489731.1 hypothetical protein [Nocardiopsis metallicus]
MSQVTGHLPPPRWPGTERPHAPREPTVPTRPDQHRAGRHRGPGHRRGACPHRRHRRVPASSAVAEAAAADHPHRPQAHFTPAENWINDPNGLVCHDGLYHPYFQYNPEGDRWGDLRVSPLTTAPTGAAQ